MRAIPIAALAVCSVALAAPRLAAAEERRIDWLRQHAVSLATLDPAAPELDDLDFLGERLAGVRVVLLGEATRGDGGAFLAKTRLVRYLHERLGYDLLAFECGFYDCARAWSEIRAGGAARPALAALFPFYTEAAEFQPLVEHLVASARSAKPLELAGIDSQSSPEVTGRLVGELRAALGGEAIDAGAAAALAEVAPVLRDLADEAYATGVAKVPEQRERRAFLDALTRLREHSRDSGAVDDAAWWQQVLANLESWARGSWQMGRFDPAAPQLPELHNLRDRQMAENLLWLAERDSERKIVVWSLTVHLARDVDRLVTGDPALRTRLGRMSGVGDRVAEALGEAAYTIAVTAAEGAKGTPFREPAPLLAPTRGSFEDLMARAGLSAAFVDLRRPAAGGEWLRRPLVAKPISYVELLGRWPRHIDGLLFLRTMTPATRPLGGAERRP